MCAREKVDGVVIDSTSDFWLKTLEDHTKVAASLKGNGFLAWAKIGPRWQALLSAVNNAPFHVVTCFRVKDHLVQRDGKIDNIGKKVIGRGGNKGVKHEYQIIFTLGDDHLATLVKDNSHQFSEWTPQLITKEVGTKIRDWLAK